jgi:toxin HigB-1
VIKSFRHKGVERFFRTGSKRGIQPKHADRLRKQIFALDNARAPTDMNAPGWRLHALFGDLAGHWSVDVSGNWRLTFTFEGEDAVLVDYHDYHRGFSDYAHAQSTSSRKRFAGIPGRGVSHRRGETSRHHQGCTFACVERSGGHFCRNGPRTVARHADAIRSVANISESAEKASTPHDGFAQQSGLLNRFSSVVLYARDSSIPLIGRSVLRRGILMPIVLVGLC